MPNSQPKGGLDASKSTAYQVGAAGRIGNRIADTIMESVKHSIDAELKAMPPQFKAVSNLAKMALSSIPGAKDNPLGAGLMTVAGFITKEEEDISNNELLANIKEEMRRMEDRVYEMFQSRPYAELANAIDLFESYKNQGLHGDGLKWLKKSENLMNVNLRQLTSLMQINPGSHVAMDMLGHVLAQGQIYMSILDTLCSVDLENAAGYATKRKNFARDTAASIRDYNRKWRAYFPAYIQRTGGLFGLIGPFGWEIMFWNDWIGGYPHGEWTSSQSSSSGWDDKWVDDPMSCVHLNSFIEMFLRNRTDLFGNYNAMIAKADFFEQWAH